MTVLNEADAIRLGTQEVDAVYVGAEKVWPSGFDPLSISGLHVWLDASQLGLADGAAVSAWPNLGAGADPGIVPGTAGTEPLRVKMGVSVSGLPVVRFTASGSRVRSASDWGGPLNDYTLVYVARFWGANVGRAFSIQYPPSNLLVGIHSSGYDVMYDNGAWLYGPLTGSWPTTWRMWGADSAAGLGSMFFSDGVAAGGTRLPGAGVSFQGGWALSGYDAVGAQETMDLEVAEMVIYNRRLSTVERQQVEQYLRDKWLTVPPAFDPATQAYLDATGLDVSFAPALDTLVTTLKSKGLWAKMRAIYPMVGGTAALHKWNLKDPRDLDAAYRLTFTGGAHSGPLGYRPNAQGAQVNGSYADTHFVPRGVLDQDSSHLSFHSLQDVPPVSRTEMGCFQWDGISQARFHIIARYQPSEFYYGMSENGFANVTVPASSGLFVATRNGLTQSAYRLGSLVGSSDVASIALPNVSVWLGGINTFADKTDLPCGFASIGDGLSATNVADLNAAVVAFQTALGR